MPIIETTPFDPTQQFSYPFKFSPYARLDQPGPTSSVSKVQCNVPNRMQDLEMHIILTGKQKYKKEGG